MFRKLLGVSFVIMGTIVGNSPRVALAQQYLTTHNSFVTAQVSHDGWGLITVYRTGTTPSVGSLMHPNTSYLTVAINGGYYTNNPNLPDTAPPAVPAAPTALLDSGTDAIHPGVDGSDTIETVWHPDPSFDIVQDLYPVLFPNGGGHIIFRVYVVDYSSSTLTAQVQYLLDVDIITSASSSNDNAKIATRDGYGTTWGALPGNTPFFMTAEHDLGTVNFPGEVAAGFFSDSLAPISMGLTIPLDSIILVNWDDVVQYYTWGWPGALPGTPFADEAMLLQWHSATIRPQIDSVAELARMSYGLGGYESCSGAIDAYSFYRYSSHLVPFTVSTLLFNPSRTVGYNNVKATLSADPSFRFLGPFELDEDSLSQTEWVEPFKADTVMFPASSEALAEWKLAVVAPSKTLSQMYLGVSEGPLPDTAVSCDLPIVPLRQADILPPVITILSRSGSYDGSECNMRCTNLVTIDSGQDQTGIFFINPGAMKNMQLTLAGKDTLGGARKYFSVCVIDSMLDGSGTVYCIDGAQNIDSMYFTYCTIPDTLAPLVTPVSGSGTINLSIADNRPWDRRLDSVQIISDTNMTVTFLPAHYSGSSNVVLTATVIDTTKPSGLCIRARDLAGNVTDTCFTLPAGAHPPPDAVAGNPSLAASSLSIEPNPTTGEVTLHITGAMSANVEVFDVLGREVTSFRIDGNHIWQTGTLPEGTYFIRAEIGGKVITKKINI